MKIHIRSRRYEIVFRYKENLYRYVYESTASYGFTYIYDHPSSACGTCIYSTSIPTQTNNLGREIYQALHDQKILAS